MKAVFWYHNDFVILNLLRPAWVALVVERLHNTTSWPAPKISVEIGKAIREIQTKSSPIKVLQTASGRQNWRVARYLSDLDRKRPCRACACAAYENENEEFNRTQLHDQAEEYLKSSIVLHLSDCQSLPTSPDIFACLLPIFALNILQSSEAGTYLTIISW